MVATTLLVVLVVALLAVMAAAAAAAEPRRAVDIVRVARERAAARALAKRAELSDDDDDDDDDSSSSDDDDDDDDGFGSDFDSPELVALGEGECNDERRQLMAEMVLALDSVTYDIDFDDINYKKVAKKFLADDFTYILDTGDVETFFSSDEDATPAETFESGFAAQDASFAEADFQGLDETRTFGTNADCTLLVDSKLEALHVSDGATDFSTIPLSYSYTYGFTADGRISFVEETFSGMATSVYDAAAVGVLAEQDEGGFAKTPDNRRRNTAGTGAGVSARSQARRGARKSALAARRDPSQLRRITGNSAAAAAAAATNAASADDAEWNAMLAATDVVEAAMAEKLEKRDALDAHGQCPADVQASIASVVQKFYDNVFFQSGFALLKAAFAAPLVTDDVSLVLDLTKPAVFDGTTTGKVKARLIAFATAFSVDSAPADIFVDDSTTTAGASADCNTYTVTVQYQLGGFADAAESSDRESRNTDFGALTFTYSLVHAGGKVTIDAVRVTGSPGITSAATARRSRAFFDNRLLLPNDEE